jgi:glycosyltransferase involved in cell wall biosynthesis
MIVPMRDPYVTRRRLTAALVKAERLNPRLGSVAWSIHDTVLGASSAETREGVEFRTARDLGAATKRLHPAGGLLVVNSLRRLDLERLLRLTRATGSRSCWYLREDSSLLHASDLGGRVDVLIANSRPLALEAGSISGRFCHFIPSVVSLDGLEPPSRREVILLVNTEPDRGLHEAIALAERLPDLRFVLQESWPTSQHDIDRLEALIANLPNVEFRRRADRSVIYRDARMLISPHSAATIGNQRPRVALEAQALGIPMISYDVPGLAAVSASPDLLIPIGAPVGRWVDAVQKVDAELDRYSREASEFAARELQSPAEIWTSFAAATEL